MRHLGFDIDRKDFDRNKAQSSESQKHYSLVLDQTLRPHNGHTCFEYNLETGEVRVAKIEERAVNYLDAEKGRVSFRGKIIKNDNCVYDTALNKKNFIKKMKKIYKDERL